MYTCNYTMTIFVIIFYYMNAIVDMQNEKGLFKLLQKVCIYSGLCDILLKN